MSFRSILEKAGVPEHQRDEAIKVIRKGSFYGLIPMVIGLFAPIVVGIAMLLKLVKWEDNKMPWYLSWFDNNVSMNGDGWGTITASGEHLNYTDWVLINGGMGRAVFYGDPDYKGDCYYAKGHHPRSRWARWIWLGWRNRASALGMKLGGKFDNLIPTTTYGKISTGRDDPAATVYNRDGLWQIKENRVLFFGLIAMNRNFGYKVNNTDSEPNSPAMCIFIPFAFKGIKKKKGDEDDAGVRESGKALRVPVSRDGVWYDGDQRIGE